ncbi:MAG: hypothetical protein Q9182_005369 [Xanthomendoza sp. 2 TL-2023]
MSLILQSSGLDNALYSFQDAFHTFSNIRVDIRGVNTITLYSDGCYVANGYKDCAQACQEPDLIFDNTATLHNCLQYPVVVNALSERSFDNDSAAVAREYAIIPNDTSGATSTIQAIQQCLTDYTDSLPKSSAIRQDEDDSLKICHGSTPDLCYYHTDICQSVYAPVIDDIAGVGIYTSYWMQNGIALVAFALLRIFDFWIYFLTIALLGCLYGFKEAQAKAEWVRQSALRHRVPNLISALFEFQKAQCFFMIAVQAAAIITVQQGGFEAKTLQQLSNSYSAITLVAICGYLPVVFTLLNLHGANQDSWYVIALATITVVISGVTAFTTKEFKPSQNDLIGLHNVTGSWASCGNKNPTTFCLSPHTVDPFEYGGGAKHIFIFCIIVLTLIVIDKFRISQGLSPSKIQMQTRRYGHSRRTHTSILKQRTLTGLSALSRVPTYYSNLNVKTRRTINTLMYGCVSSQVAQKAGAFNTLQTSAVYGSPQHPASLVGRLSWSQRLRGGNRGFSDSTTLYDKSDFPERRVTTTDLINIK